MTPSLKPDKATFTSGDILPIIAKLYPENTNNVNKEKTLIRKKRELLQRIFTRFAITKNFDSYPAFLNRLNEILEMGMSSSTHIAWNNLKDFNLQTEWTAWQRAITEAKAIYRDLISSTESNDSQTFFYTKSDSKRADCILQRRYEVTEANQTGIMLLYTATLMLPEDRLKKINLEDLTYNFKEAITFADIFDKLPLDMSNDPGASLKKAQAACKIHIKNVIYDDNYKIFLRYLINSAEVFITGRYIHTRIRTDKSGPKPSDLEKKVPYRAKIHRPTKFYEYPQEDEVPNIGTFTYLEAAPGEEPVYSLIESPATEAKDVQIPKVCSDADMKVSSKYWIQQYSEAIPWNSNGINPFTLKLLSRWITQNDSKTALIISLLLCIGIKTTPIMALTIGHNGDITPEGIFKHKYSPPSKHFTPNKEQEKTLTPTKDTIFLQLPKIVIKLLERHIDKNVENITLSEALEIDSKEMESKITDVIKELKPQGGKGLALDRIHLSLRKKISQLTDDDLIGYMITSSKKESPPISSYYSRINQKYLQNIYNEAIKELFKC